MPFVIYATASRPLKADRKTWSSIQADANCRAPGGPPKWVEEYHCARALGYRPEEAWEIMRKHMAGGTKP